jgi:hypothetical protein
MDPATEASSRSHRPNHGPSQAHEGMVNVHPIPSILERRGGPPRTAVRLYLPPSRGYPHQSHPHLPLNGAPDVLQTTHTDHAPLAGDGHNPWKPHAELEAMAAT